MYTAKAYSAASATSPLASTTYERLLKSYVKYRFSVDMASLKSA